MGLLKKIANLFDSKIGAMNMHMKLVTRLEFLIPSLFGMGAIDSGNAHPLKSSSEIFLKV